MLCNMYPTCHWANNTCSEPDPFCVMRELPSQCQHALGCVWDEEQQECEAHPNLHPMFRTCSDTQKFETNVLTNVLACLDKPGCQWDHGSHTCAPDYVGLCTAIDVESECVSTPGCFHKNGTCWGSSDTGAECQHIETPEECEARIGCTLDPSQTCVPVASDPLRSFDGFCNKNFDASEFHVCASQEQCADSCKVMNSMCELALDGCRITSKTGGCYIHKDPEECDRREQCEYDSMEARCLSEEEAHQKSWVMTKFYLVLGAISSGIFGVALAISVFVSHKV